MLIIHLLINIVINHPKRLLMIFAFDEQLREKDGQFLKRISLGEFPEISNHQCKIGLVVFYELAVEIDDVVDNFLEIVELLILEYIDEDGMEIEFLEQDLAFCKHSVVFLLVVL